MTCPSCEHPDDRRLASFNGLRHIVASVPDLSQYIWAAIHSQFPSLVELVSDPQRWEGGLSSLLGSQANRLEPSLIYFDVVEAPLDCFSASYLRLNCPVCLSKSTVIVINAAFLALIRNVLATSLDRGLPISQLRDLVSDLRVDATRLRRGPYREDASHEMLKALIPGIGWIICHEAAHAVGGTAVDRNCSDVPEWCRGDVAAELNADFVALQMLFHRILATPYVGEIGARLRALSDGIEMMIRGLVLIDLFRSGHQRDIDCCRVVYEDGSPTPTFRWNFLSGAMSLWATQGTLGIDMGTSTLIKNWMETASLSI